MNEEEKLAFFIQRLKELSMEKLKVNNTTALQALKESINYIEGEFLGY